MKAFLVTIVDSVYTVIIIVSVSDESSDDNNTRVFKK